MKNDFIPDREADVITLEKNFLEKFESYALVLNLHPEDITETVSIIEGHTDSFSNMVSKKAEMKSAVEENHARKIRAERELRRVAKIMKSSRKYTPAIGDDLGIIGSEAPPKDFTSLKPVLKTSVNAGEVTIKYRKEGMQGVSIYTRRGDEKEFTFLVRNSLSPYKDVRDKLVESKPEQREYYAVYLNNYKETGVSSHIVKVTIS